MQTNDNNHKNRKHLTFGLFTALLILGTTAPVSSASDGFDKDAWADHCVSESEAVAAEFEQHPDGVPQDTAFAGVQRINAACYATLPLQPSEATVAMSASRLPVDPGVQVNTEGLLELDAKKVCSGPTTTVTGWRDAIVILGKPFPVAHTPASGDLTWYELSKDEYAAAGYIRSTLDDLAFEFDPKSDEAGSAFWNFAALPMAGIVKELSGKCLLGAAYRTAAEVHGLPLVWGIQPESIKSLIAPPLYVEAGGTLCLPAC